MYLNGHLSFLHNPLVFWNKINDIRKIIYDPNILIEINLLPANYPTFSLGLPAAQPPPLLLLPCLSLPTKASPPQETIEQITIVTTHSSQCELLLITFEINFCARSHCHKAIKRQIETVVCLQSRSTIINHIFQFHIKIPRKSLRCA